TGQRIDMRKRNALNFGIMWVAFDHLYPSGRIMPDHAGDRGAADSGLAWAPRLASSGWLGPRSRPVAPSGQDESRRRRHVEDDRAPGRQRRGPRPVSDGFDGRAQDAADADAGADGA